jgi:hypothetical protein
MVTLGFLAPILSRVDEAQRAELQRAMTALSEGARRERPSASGCSGH